MHLPTPPPKKGTCASTHQHCLPCCINLVLLLHPQVVMRWRRLSEGVARQGAVVERAVRMYNFRYIQALQRSVLQVRPVAGKSCVHPVLLPKTGSC
jgi:hypothetical protein